MATLFCTVINDRGLRFNVRLIRKGERYGLKGRLVHDDAMGLGAMVEIYDARHTRGFTQFGQFVSSYYVSSLLADADKPSHKAGLDMHGGVADWSLDPVAFEMLCRELRMMWQVNPWDTCGVKGTTP